MVYPPWQAQIDEKLSNLDKLMASFCEAASGGDFGLVIYLMVRVGLDPMRACMKQGWSGKSPLMVACISGESDCVAAMLSLNLSATNVLDSILHTRCDFGCTAFDYACQYRHEKCISLLLHTGVPYNSAITPTFRAIALTMLKKLDVPLDSSVDECVEENVVRDRRLRLKGRLAELTYKLTPLCMVLSLVGTFVYLMVRLMYFGTWPTVADDGISFRTLLFTLLMESTVCLLVIATIRSGAGIYSAKSESSGIEYADWIKNECLEADLEASPRTQGVKVADTNAYRARLELTRATMQVHCCHICRCWRPAGTRHSKKSNKCVREFDHYCYFFASDIGLSNRTCFELAVLAFNMTLPLLLIDMSWVLTGRNELLLLLLIPVTSVTRIISSFSSSYTEHSAFMQETCLALSCMWLYLIWIFVVLLAIQQLYKRLRKISRSFSSLEKKNQ